MLHACGTTATVTIALIALATVNIITLTWTLAVEAKVNMAITRALGATPGQISAGLSVARLLPALPALSPERPWASSCTGPPAAER
ncbi:MAG TPA: FtsX-like permease family protein [Nonomuraea sp.]|nr:FtsX-like permease family protein [Nonomuraea sp.]